MMAFEHRGGCLGSAPHLPDGDLHAVRQRNIVERIVGLKDDTTTAVTGRGYLERCPAKQILVLRICPTRVSRNDCVSKLSDAGGAVGSEREVDLRMVWPLQRDVHLHRITLSRLRAPAVPPVGSAVSPAGTVTGGVVTERAHHASCG